MEPHEYPKRILISVSGLSPQIVTETIYALARPVRGDPPFVPTSVHLLTTTRGADYARKTLLGADPGWFHRLCRDYGLSGIQFGEDHIHVLRGGHGDLHDIRSREDNEHAADQITAFIRALTQDPSSAVHVSMAGGRKTMGYYAGYALSLFGRAQDRLSHVLVADPFEGHPEFFYPTRERNIIRARDKDGTPLDTREASVDLATIPFVRLRGAVAPSLLNGRISFTRFIEGTQRSLGIPELVVDTYTARIRCAGTVIKLPPAQFAFLAWFARRVLQGRPQIRRKGLSETDLQEYLREYEALPGSRQERPVSLTHDRFTELKSKIERTLKRALGPDGAQPYLIRTDGKKMARFFLGLTSTQIRFEDIEAAPAGRKQTGKRSKKG